ncbi:MAG: methylated-DNA--[protein]-cysteine S-methyltransferase [Gammaproteobacteria bacterium]|jgi:AraC family transcriptional regulator of adaptative response/methylated-DNA-[protein]-cysteine methyltransferase|nr:methylated-DNA--[protein]-cysteine S-methyltransferase [Gammaproteobacteria bacterium]
MTSRSRPSDDRTGLFYAHGGSAIGRLLLIHDGNAVHALLPGDDDGELLLEARRRFGGELTRDESEAGAAMLARIGELIESGSTGCAATPLAPDGTPFQRRVWDVLRALPVGATASYGDIARRMGRPSAARAVARACGANPIAVLIPCHRVVRGDGGLGGYRWGLQRKRELLRRETAMGRAGPDDAMNPN